MTQSNIVLIVGSGPTGMIMAARLTALGIPVRLVDRLTNPVTTSRAFTIHARTLELMGLLGLEDDFLARSIKTYSMDYHFPNKDEVPKLDFTALNSVYPFCLTINQADTEEILRNHLQDLGVEIEWQTQLEALTQDEANKLTVTLRHLDTDTREDVAVDWLIGCDGIHSAVREQLDVPFDGSEYEGTMRMIDVGVTGFNQNQDAIHYFIAKDHMLLMNKLPGENYRVLISDKTEGVPPEEARAAFQAVLEQHFGDQMQLDEPVWSTNFRISRRKVNSYRQGNIFLAGDSAHVNSPAGGQGMNVAMQDAFNLSWKLAMVLKGEAQVSFLDTYEAERGPVAQQMLEGTNYIHSIIMAHGRGMEERIALMQGGEWNKQAVNQVAGISYTYRQADDNAPDNAPTLAIGDRAPDAQLTNGERIYHLIQPDGYTLFLLLGTAGTKADYDRLQNLAQRAASQFKAKITSRIIVLPALASQITGGAIIDDGTIHRRYESLAAGKAYLLRPDYHIADCRPLAEAEAVITALGDILLPA